MRQYLTHPAFWFSVVIVAVLVNWIWGKFVGSKLV